MDTFEDRHAQIDPDPIIELKRRLKPWASAPPSRGKDLDAAIVPIATIQSALAELTEWRKVGEAIKRSKMRGSAKPQ